MTGKTGEYEGVERKPFDLSIGYVPLPYKYKLSDSSSIKNCIKSALMIRLLFPKPEMPKKRGKTLSFICELPLRVTQQQEVILLTRLEAGRQLYNTCLGETMRRLRLIRQSKDYNAARTLKKNNHASLLNGGNPRTQLAPQRLILFKRARERWGLSDYEVQAYATRVRHSWIADHIDAHTAQKLATRAYAAAEKVMYGRAKSVRFKGKDQLDSRFK